MLFSFFDIVPLLYYFAFTSLLIVIFIYDLKWTVIPDFATAGILVLALISWGAELYGSAFAVADLVPTLAVAFLVAVLFGGIWYVSKGRAMGFGDVKLAPALVLFLGGIKGLLAVLLSFWMGAAVGIAFIVVKKASMKSQIPFGPYLALGAFLSLIWGESMVQAYVSFVGF